MDKVAIDQAMKLDEKLDVLSARFAKVKTIAKEAAVETALAVSDVFTGDFWKLLAANLAKGAGMQSAALASMQMRFKEAADAGAEASNKQAEAGKKAADAAGLVRMKEEELYNERLKLLSQGKENVDLLLKLQEAQEKFNTAIEKGLSHKEKEKALNAVLSIREQIKAARMRRALMRRRSTRSTGCSGSASKPLKSSGRRKPKRKKNGLKNTRPSKPSSRPRSTKPRPNSKKSSPGIR